MTCVQPPLIMPLVLPTFIHSIYSFKYVVREAAKKAGLWDKCPYMEEITPQTLDTFYEHVSYYLYKVG